ncbi:MAG TPA: hypothetical protein VNV86_19830 [Candidatus Acidoferrum sp.]|nr:hypothetical protein [Candidatus Acidoferrum sp.]
MVVAALVFAATVGSQPWTQEILGKVAETAARRHTVSYSGTRTYAMRNYRFNKEARVTVRMTYQPGEGKHFTVLDRSGSDRLLDIIQQIIDTEVEASRPGEILRKGLTPENYAARLRGTDTTGGRECWVLEVKPRSKSKFLINGTAWVDKSTFDVVRLDGVTSASLSIWVGTPRIVEDRAEFDGIWLPARLKSRSSTLLTGESELDIAYTGYQIQR